MASDPKKLRKHVALMAGLEGLAILLIGVGVGLHNLGGGLVAAGLLMWINITIGGLRKR